MRETPTKATMSAGAAPGVRIRPARDGVLVGAAILATAGLCIALLDRAYAAQSTAILLSALAGVGVFWLRRGALRAAEEQESKRIPLREALERFEQVVGRAPSVAIQGFDRRGVILHWNDACEHLYGYSAGEVLGRRIQDVLLAGGTVRAFEETLGEVWETGRAAAPQEWQVRTRGGLERWVYSSIFPVFERGAVAEVFCVDVDITQRRQNEDLHKHYLAAMESAHRALEEAYAAAERASCAKSEFLANMSHEIRTPMTAILGYSEILLETAGGPDCLEAARTIKRNGEYLLEIINGVLDLSKIEAGKSELEPSACSCCQILSDVVSLMRVRAEAKGLSLSVDYEGPIPETICTDPTRLRQILINLVGNAVKFTETGEVRIASRLLEHDQEHPRLQIDVADTGIGMTREQAERLFRPFAQADAATLRKFGGTGLGLAISRRLAKLLGGELSVTSELGKGSTFRLTIPTGPLAGVRMVDHPAESLTGWQKPAPPAREPSLRLDCRILLAEDGPDNQRLISYVLKKAGAEVVIAGNGQEALETVLAAQSGQEGKAGGPPQPFDLVLMDIQMPVMDGFEATRRLRQAGYHGPIIALTAHAMAEDRQKCLDAGCSDYTTKPIDRSTLLAAVARITSAAASPWGHSEQAWAGRE